MREKSLYTACKKLITLQLSQLKSICMVQTLRQASANTLLSLKMTTQHLIQSDQQPIKLLQSACFASQPTLSTKTQLSSLTYKTKRHSFYGALMLKSKIFKVTRMVTLFCKKRHYTGVVSACKTKIVKKWSRSICASTNSAQNASEIPSSSRSIKAAQKT